MKQRVGLHRRSLLGVRVAIPTGKHQATVLRDDEAGAGYVVLGKQARHKGVVGRQRRYGRASLRLNDPGREREKQCPPELLLRHI